MLRTLRQLLGLQKYKQPDPSLIFLGVTWNHDMYWCPTTRSLIAVYALYCEPVVFRHLPSQVRPDSNQTWVKALNLARKKGLL